MVIHIALFLSDIMDGCYGFDHSYKQQLDWLAIIDTIRDNEVDEDTRRWDHVVGTDTLGQSFFFLANLYQYNILENKTKNILVRRLLLNYDSTKIVIFVSKDI